MNITPFTIYMISRLDAVSIFFSIMIKVFSCATAMLIVASFVSAVDYGVDSNFSVLSRRYAKWFAGILAVLTLCSVLLPRSRDVAAMIVVPRIANSQSVSDIGESIVGLAKAWCDELKPENVKKGKKEEK